ncbi:MAG: DNA-protecting protein DprA [Candidatus Riflebacteria bacterium]|nr:DNA-protecting protein DprA [Candidatus Riflebacteria bacterium]
MRSDPRLPWLRLAGISWLGETVKCGLIKEFQTPEAVFAAAPAQLSIVQGWSSRRLARFIQERDSVKPICEPELLDAKGIALLTFNDPGYPPLLRHIHDAPVALFALGDTRPDPRPHLAIIGARNGSQQGYDIARQFAVELAAAGFVIVSGLALGIDTYAHKGAIEAGGRTIAFLGGGIDLVYPAGNRRVREYLLKSGGLLLSEYPPGMPAQPWHFPVRNRLISGSCLGTLVVEATARSGSLITARLSGEQDREIFAVPGGIRNKLSEGTLALISDGAVLVTSPGDLIEHYADLLPDHSDSSDTGSISSGCHSLSDDERGLIDLLTDDPISIDCLLSNGRWPRDRLFSMLLDLELRELVVKYPGNYYQSKVRSLTDEKNHPSALEADKQT